MDGQGGGVGVRGVVAWGRVDMPGTAAAAAAVQSCFMGTWR